MDKEKAIEQINLTKQRVNEGSRAFRDQIDFNVLPLVAEDSVVTGLVKESRAAWTSADRVAKDWLEQAIARILQPEPEFPPPVPILQLQGGGFFNWHKLFRDVAGAKEYLIQAKLAGYSLHDSFSFLSDNHPNHRNLTYLTPFYWDGNNFHLDRKNPEFWEMFREILELHKEVGLDFMIQLWMRADYISYPYRRNVHAGVTDFWDEAAMPFHRLYVEWIMEAYREVYGNDYLAFIKIMNEVAHHGNGHKFHTIMHFHEMIWDMVLSKYIPLNHVVCDQTGCEGTVGELREAHLCPRQATCDRKAWLKVVKVTTSRIRFYDAEKDAYYNVNREKYPELKKGDRIKLGRHGDNAFSRRTGDSAVGEFHKIATWEDYDLKDNPTNFERRRSEDGGGRAENGLYIIGNKRMADGNQSEFLGRKLGKYHKDTGAFPYHVHFTHEVLHRKPDGLWVPVSTYERVKPTFERAKRFATGYWEAMG